MVCIKLKPERTSCEPRLAVYHCSVTICAGNAEVLNLQVKRCLCTNSGDTRKLSLCRREVLDGFLRDRAKANGANVINGLMLRMDVPKDDDSPYIIHYTDYAEVCLLAVVC